MNSPSGHQVCFRINDATVCHDGPPQRRLLDILREDHGLTGAKPGCEIGRCGTCTVWVDERPANACLVMAWQLADRHVQTIEGVAGREQSAPVRQALAEAGAVQCGYCSAGLVMTLTHLLCLNPRPDVTEASRLISGHLCRCTGYGGIQRAIERLF